MYVVYVMYILTYLSMYIYIYIHGCLVQLGIAPLPSFSPGATADHQSGWENSQKMEVFSEKTLENMGKYPMFMFSWENMGKYPKTLENMGKIWGKYRNMTYFHERCPCSSSRTWWIFQPACVDFPISKFSNHSQFAEINKVGYFGMLLS